MKHLNMIFGSLGAMCTLAMLISSGPPTIKPSAPIKLSEIDERGIEGRLGHRLGEIVEISGKVVPNTSRRKMDMDVPYFLNIDHVNGRRLSTSIQERFVRANHWVKLDEPSIGDDFRYIGYETGGYHGSPAGEEKYTPPLPTYGYGFSTDFLILAKK